MAAMMSQLVDTSLCWALRQRRVAGVRLEVIYGQEAEGFYAWQELLRDRRDERDTQ